MRILILTAVLALPASAQLAFEPNRGQTDPSVRFLARTSEASVFFTSSEVVLAGSSAPLRLELLNAGRGAAWETAEPNGKTTSYIRGRDQSQWVRDVPQYARLLRRGVYPGIDVAYYGNAGRLEYDFLLAPHADPARIRMRIAGASRLRMEADGALLVETAGGSLRQAKPVAYQTAASGARIPVEGRFRLIGRDTVAFAVGRYDAGLPLAIDPVLVSSSYIGGHGDDRIVAVGSGGQYAGATTSIDFPGAAYGRRTGDDIVVSNGNAVFVIGGSGNDEVTGAYFGYNFMVVVGYTDSQDLPTNATKLRYVVNPTIWQPNFAGGATDGFFLWISPGAYNTAAEIYLSYIGTPGDDRITGISAWYSDYALVGTTTGTGLPGVGAANIFVPTPIQPIQSAPAGGTDGFLMLIGGFDIDPTILAATLFGGSGDDRPLGIWSSYSSTFHITGETNSPDFPLVNPLFSTRAGDTDAFLMRISIQNSAFQITASTLLGGSQADRGVAVALNAAGNLVVAGTTSSPDLPVTAGAAQPAYGGGASDVFVAQFPPDLSQLVSLTYYGGSSAEEATAVAADPFGSVYVGGWTSSLDFPTKNAVQPTYGGGPDDGFLLHFDGDGSLFEATYFGGSGSDRIYGLYANSDFTVWLGGQTTSSDLPVLGAGAATLTGPSDGFLARIGAGLLGAYPCSGANHLRASCQVEVGALNGSSAAPLTITSTDPSSVLVAPDATSASQASTTVTPQPDYYADYRPFAVDCQVDSGGADLTISAPGYASRTLHVNCYPVQVLVQAYSGTYQNAQGTVMTNSWNGPAKFTAYLEAANPNPPFDRNYVYPSPSVPAVTVQISSSNPAAGTADPSISFTSPTPAYSTTSSFTFQPLAPGSTVLTFSSPQVSVSGSYPIVVQSPIGVQGYAIPGGFQTQIVPYSGQAPTGATATITSQDPSSLVFSTDPNQPGSGALTVPLGSATVYAQAMASTGDIPVTVAVAGLDPVTAPVHLAPPVVFCEFCSTAGTMAPLTQLSFTPYIGAAGSPGHMDVSRNPGLDPVVLTIATSDATVVSVPSTSITIGGGTPAYAQSNFTITAAGTGTATVTMQATGGVVPDPSASPIAVTVQNPTLKMSDLEVGKDLAGYMSLILPAIPASKVTVAVADPTLALLSTNNQAAGQAQISLTTSPYQTVGFYVQGLASSGQTQVTATVAGYGSVTATVHLDPAGLLWSSATFTGVQYSSGTWYSYLGAYALDAASLLPVANQALRFGASAPFQLRNSNPGVVTITPASLSVPTTAALFSVGLAGKSTGTANLTIVQPAGFSTPSILQTLAVTVQEASLTLSDTAMAKDTQQPVTVNIPGNGSQQLTITSSDPSKLVLSTSASSPGSASVTITAGTSQQVLAQALDSQGTVKITASAPGYKDAVATYTLRGLGVGIAVASSPFNPGSTVQTNGAPLTTTQSPTTTIALSLYLVDTASGQGTAIGYQVTFRAGVAPPPVTVTSSDTTVGKILRSPAVLVPSGYSSQVTVDFSPVGLGNTTVSVVQPPGFFAPAGLASIPFQVTLPGFTAFNTLMGKDTIVSLSPALLSTVSSPTSNVNVTITSGDPSRVLLSSAADNNTAATLTKVLVAGQRAVNSFYVHALANNGVVTLKMTAPGYSDTLLTVTLTDLMFKFAQPFGSSSVRAVMQNGPQTYSIIFELPPQNGATGGYTTPTIRPGAPNIALTVATSDRTILAIDNPQIPLAPGATSASVAARPVSTGAAVLTLTAPSGYRTDLAANTLSVSVEGAKLSFPFVLSSLGRDLQSGLNVSSESSFKQATPITITSSDPSRLLLSADGKSPGQASVTVAGTTGSSLVGLFVQALSDNGSATLIASADGYQTASMPVALAPSAAVFGSVAATQTLYTNSPVQSLSVMLATLDPATLRPVGSGFAPRPGVNLTATLASSDKTVLSATPSTLTFTNSTPIQVQVQPAGIGTAILAISPLPGGAVAASEVQIVYTVAEPDLYIGDAIVGRDLQVPLQVRLASRLPAPATDLTLNVETWNQFGAPLSNSPTITGTNPGISVTIPAGQHLSKPFYLQGVYPGATSLYVYGSGYNSSTSAVTVAQTAFIFQEALQSQTIALPVGTSTTLTVTPEILPIGTPTPAGMTIRGGVSPITLLAADLNPQVVSVTPTSVTLQGGDRNATVTVRGLAAGAATVSLGGSSAYQYPAAQASVTLQVR